MPGPFLANTNTGQPAVSDIEFLSTKLHSQTEVQKKIECTRSKDRSTVSLLVVPFLHLVITDISELKMGLGRSILIPVTDFTR